MRSGSRKKATHQMVSGSSSTAQPRRNQEGQQIDRREEGDERPTFPVNGHGHDASFERSKGGAIAAPCETSKRRQAPRRR